MGKIQCIAKKVLEKVEVVGHSTSAVGRAVERVAIKLKDKIKVSSSRYLSCSAGRC